MGTLAFAGVPTMSGGSNRHGHNSRGEEAGIPIPTRLGNANVSASTVTGAQGGIGPQDWEDDDALSLSVRGPSGELLSG